MWGGGGGGLLIRGWHYLVTTVITFWIRNHQSFGPVIQETETNFGPQCWGSPTFRVLQKDHFCKFKHWKNASYGKTNDQFSKFVWEEPLELFWELKKVFQLYIISSFLMNFACASIGWVMTTTHQPLTKTHFNLSRSSRQNWLNKAGCITRFTSTIFTYRLFHTSSVTSTSCESFHESLGRT